MNFRKRSVFEIAGPDHLVRTAFNELVENLSESYFDLTGKNIEDILSSAADKGWNEAKYQSKEVREGRRKPRARRELAKLQCEAAAHELAKLEEQLNAVQWDPKEFDFPAFAKVALGVGRAAAHAAVEQALTVEEEFKDRKASSGAQKGARERALKAFVEISLHTRISDGLRCSSRQELVREILGVATEFYNHRIFQEKISASSEKLEKIINNHLEKDEEFDKTLERLLKKASAR